jgi:hypothetical protein
MTFRMMLVVAAASVLLSTGYAVAENAQQDKMKTCNSAATAKGLKGDGRKEFNVDVGGRPTLHPFEKIAPRASAFVGFDDGGRTGIKS